MFQLAFGHAASQRLGTTLSLLGAPDRELTDNFELGEWARRSVRIRRKVAFRARHLRRERLIVDNERDEPTSVIANLRDGVRFSGFFQSERYFAGYEDDVRAMFSLREHARTAFTQRYGGIDPYVAVHVRRLDYAETPWMLPAGFYRDALEAAGDIEGMPVVVVSDDLEAARSEFSDLPGAQFESNEAIVDLQLLMNAEVVITSASSFSWWGAWLNRRPAARILAPRHWLGFARGVEEPRQVVPERWIQVPVPRRCSASRLEVTSS